jgi:hypothetical protein
MPTVKDIQAEIDKVVNKMTLDELRDPAVPPAPTPEPDPTDQQVRDIVHALWHPAQHNGFLGIARSVGVSTSTVKLTEKARLKRIHELTPEVID